MAFQRRGGGGNATKPKWNINFSVKVGNEYKKGPSIGLWPADSGPMARGSTKGEYAKQLADFFDQYCEKEFGISVSLFENKEDGDGGSRRSSRHSDEGEERSSRRESSRREEPAEEEDASKFEVGDSVTFEDDDGNDVAGTVTKVKGDNLIIEDEDGEKYVVEAADVEAAEEEEEDKKPAAKKKKVVPAAPAKKKKKRKLG